MSAETVQARPRTMWWAGGALLAYLALAFGVFAGAWRHPTTTGIGGPGDPQQFMWLVAWTQHALGHGLNPFFTDLGNYPAGVNLLWNAIPLVPALVLWPVTAAFGLVVTYNLVMTLGLALSAWTGFLLLRRYVRSPLAAAVGGLLYGFSPFMFAEAHEHPHMVLALLPPLILLLLDEIIRVQLRHPVLLGGALALVAAAQFFISEEVLVMTGVAAIVLVVIAGALWPDEVIPRSRFAASALGTAAIVFALMVAWPVAFQLRGPQHVDGTVHQQNVYVSDLLSFWVPTQTQWLPPARALRVSDGGSYVGVPLTLLLLFTAILKWKSGLVRLAVLSGSVIAILSLGVTVHVGGSNKPSLPAFAVGLIFLVLPGVPARTLVLLTFGAWLALWRLPLLDGVIPVRLTMLIYLLAGLLLAVFIDWASGLDRRRLVAGFAVVVALAPLMPRLPYPTTQFQTPPFFAPGGEVNRIPAGSVALIAPVVTYDDVEAMRWQAESGMRFRMPEGYLVIPAPSSPGSRGLLAAPTVGATDLPTATVTTHALVAARDGQTAEIGDPATRSSIRAELAAWHVRTVVVGPMTNRAAAVALLSWVLNRPPDVVQGVDVWWDVDAGAG